MAASSQRARQLPRYSIISSVDIGSNQFADPEQLRHSPRHCSKGGCGAAAFWRPICWRRRPTVCFCRPNCCFHAPFVGQLPRHRPPSDCFDGLTPTASAIMASERRPKRFDRARTSRPGEARASSGLVCGKPELDESTEGDAATSISGWEVATCSPAASPAQAAARFRRSGLRPEFNADAGDGFLARIASAARTRHSSGVQRVAPVRLLMSRSSRFARELGTGASSLRRCRRRVC